MIAILKDDTERFKQFSDNESFRRWLTDTIFAITYQDPGPETRASSATMEGSPHETEYQAR